MDAQTSGNDTMGVIWKRHHRCDLKMTPRCDLEMTPRVRVDCVSSKLVMADELIG